MPPPASPHEWELPRLRASFGFEDDYRYLSSGDQGDTEFFDVKFYPYNPVGASPIFAAVSKKHAVVCRLSQVKERDKDVNPCEIIQVIRDDDSEASNCTCTWTKDAVTEAAYLCIGGEDAKVKVYNVKEGKLVTTLAGHGGDVNDLATSPDNPQMFASASNDTTVRIWSLDPVHARQPCVCLLGGEGHSWNLLTVAWHDTGRYILSAGHDQVVNLWTVPDIPMEHMEVPIVVHYPHFSTSEIHSGLIDCVAFYGDCILSRACHEECIVLWRIEGFNSTDPPPPPSIAPTTYDPSRLTRSAFAPIQSPACPSEYTRLLQFHTPGCGVQFFMRFKLYHAEGKHPVLAFCNAGSKVFFWDMVRLTAYHDFVQDINDRAREPDAPPVQRPTWLIPFRARKEKDTVTRLRGASEGDSNASGNNISTNGPSPDPERGGAADGSPGATGLAAGHSAETIAVWEGRYSMGDPHEMLKPHKTEQFSSASFVGRQVTWSPEGEWCVVVGSRNLALILQRWDKDEPHDSRARESSK